MQHLTDAVRKAIENSNWYAALGLALTLPDICGRLEGPGLGSRERYVAWCGKYLVPRYMHRIGVDAQLHVFLHAEDCYALRCAVLHEGKDDIVEQRARKALDSFVFVAPRERMVLHCNQRNSRLQLQVDMFCEDLCKGVDRWFSDISPGEPEVVEAMENLMKIVSLEDDISM